MSLYQKIIERILSFSSVRWALNLSKRIIIPGFDGIPLYDVAVFFIRGLTRG